jgi:hypothetical protein
MKAPEALQGKERTRATAGRGAPSSAAIRAAASIHGAQMKAPAGPATREPTSSFGLQQNEHQASAAGSAGAGPRGGRSRATAGSRQIAGKRLKALGEISARRRQPEAVPQERFSAPRVGLLQRSGGGLFEQLHRLIELAAQLGRLSPPDELADGAAGHLGTSREARNATTHARSSIKSSGASRTRITSYRKAAPIAPSMTR